MVLINHGLRLDKRQWHIQGALAAGREIQPELYERPARFSERQASSPVVD